MVEYVVPIICATMASTGFWALLEKKHKSRSAETAMLIGLGHDRIIKLGMDYIERGYITEDEYDNLYNYLYVPYSKLGGNGSAARIMKEVGKLPLKKH